MISNLISSLVFHSYFIHRVTSFLYLFLYYCSLHSMSTIYLSEILFCPIYASITHFIECFIFESHPHLFSHVYVCLCLFFMTNVSAPFFSILSLRLMTVIMRMRTKGKTKFLEERRQKKWRMEDRRGIRGKIESLKKILL